MRDDTYTITTMDSIQETMDSMLLHDERAAGRYRFDFT